MPPSKDNTMQNRNGLDETKKKKSTSPLLSIEDTQADSHDPEEERAQSKSSLTDQLDALSALADSTERSKPEKPTSPIADPEEPSDLSTLEEVFWGKQDAMKAPVADKDTPTSPSHRQEQPTTLTPSPAHGSETATSAPGGEDAIYTMFLELKRDIDTIKHEHREETPPPHEHLIYDLLSELRRDINTIKHEQHESHAVSVEERELYAMLGELRRDITQLKTVQGSPLAYEAASRALVAQVGGKAASSNRQMLLVGLLLGFLIVGAGAGGFILANREDWLGSNDAAPSQQTDRPHQLVITEVAADVSGMAGTPIKLNISGAKARAAGAKTVKITGLPDIAELSAGSHEDGAWILPASGLANLSLLVPAGYSGTINPTLALIDPAGNTILRQSFQIGILGRPEAASTERKQAERPDVNAPAPKPDTKSAAEAPKLAPDEEKELLANAQSLVDQGDIVSARRVLDFAVGRGSIAAAFALAQTYDPEYINKSENLYGVRPDLTRAKVLYYFAAKGGNKNAAARLAEINKQQPSK